MNSSQSSRGLAHKPQTPQRVAETNRASRTTIRYVFSEKEADKELEAVYDYLFSRVASLKKKVDY
jgi:hypothetical protein